MKPFHPLTYTLLASTSSVILDKCCNKEVEKYKFARKVNEFENLRMYSIYIANTRTEYLILFQFLSLEKRNQVKTEIGEK